VLPKSGKYQDDRIADCHLYYYALFRAMARMAAADKRGRFDDALKQFPGGGYSAAAPLQKDSKARRAMHTKRVDTSWKPLTDFVLNYAATLFGPTLADANFLESARTEFVQMTPYFTAVQNYLAKFPELMAISHINLQIDNAWFWRKSGGEGGSASDVELECGLLDWYNTGRAPTVAVWMGCLSGVEPHILLAHEDGLMKCYSAEYHKYGGPLIDPNQLKLLFRLTFVSSFLQNFQYIQTEILKDMPSKAEWNSISDRWDPAVMGKWNVRCRTIAIMQLLGFYKQAPLFDTFMAWVKMHPELCAEPKE